MLVLKYVFALAVVLASVPTAAAQTGHINKTLKQYHMCTTNEEEKRHFIEQQCSSKQRFNMNIIYVKIPKTGSSTTAGVARRLAHKNCVSGWACAGNAGRQYDSEPHVFASHGPPVSKEALGRFKLKVLYFTVVRDPADRALSEFNHFSVSRAQHKESIESTIHSLSSKHSYMAKAMDSEANKAHSINTTQNAARIVSQYTFVGLSELYDESMVILSYLAGVPVDHVLYLSSKTNGNVDPTGVLIKPRLALKDQPMEILDYIEGDFKKNNELDYEILNVVRRKIQWWYEQSGAKEELQKRLIHFKRLRELATEKCLFEEPCYLVDNGCGYKCLDKLSLEDASAH